MKLKKSKAVLQNFKDATQYEWLETNGLGGWASSSVTGAHTRRYHGLLAAAIVPPTERMVLLSKLDETIVAGDKRTELGTNLYPGGTIHPNGHHYLNSFTKDLFPEWEYETEDVQLRKRIGMIHGENTVVIIYDVIKATNPFTLELLPLMAARGYHSLQQEGPQLHWDADFANGIFHNKPDGKTNVFIAIPGSSYQHIPRWFNNLQYSVDQYRGQEFSEDLFNHGIFSVPLKKGDSLGIIISTEDPAGRNAHDLLQTEEERRRKLLEGQPGDETVQQLVLAADQFIVKRDENLKTIIAGYHWFTDWGRDTMISLPGLTLCTGRYDDAKKIIAAFAKSVSRGMLPNRFQDNGEAPEYNTVDGTLWYFIAVYKYLHTSGNEEFVLKEILPVLKEIIDWHFKGTRYNIHVAEDGLLYAGEKGQQLTWMDAKIGDRVVTPRMGKPVEIQALWYNALCIYSELLEQNRENKKAKEFLAKAELAKQSFNELFWNKAGNYLYDVIDENNIADSTVRPNQLFAISLPFVLLEGKQAARVLKVVQEQLYAPVGLKSLPANDPLYIPVYGGDQWHRDSSYHQGTVWSWLLGPYVDAIMKVNGRNGETKARKVIDNFTSHLNEGCIGSVSE
ncbi:MAG: amylo-alpha-1,6-glucosidase, partial [Chitinophagaceae bacterium]